MKDDIREWPRLQLSRQAGMRQWDRVGARPVRRAFRTPGIRSWADRWATPIEESVGKTGQSDNRIRSDRYQSERTRPHISKLPARTPTDVPATHYRHIGRLTRKCRPSRGGAGGPLRAGLGQNFSGQRCSGQTSMRAELYLGLVRGARLVRPVAAPPLAGAAPAGTWASTCRMCWALGVAAADFFFPSCTFWVM